MRYGPSTPQVQRLLDRAQELTELERDALDATITLTHGTGRRRQLKTGRDFAWEHLHRALADHDLTGGFYTLWEDLRADLRAGSWAGFLIADAACATMLASVLDQGSFTTADYDALRAPWCAVIDSCPRSRLFLRLVPTCRPAEELWPIVEAVIAAQSR